VARPKFIHIPQYDGMAGSFESGHKTLKNIRERLTLPIADLHENDPQELEAK
jgi:hypothetical protein